MTTIEFKHKYSVGDTIYYVNQENYGTILKSVITGVFVYFRENVHHKIDENTSVLYSYRIQYSTEHTHYVDEEYTSHTTEGLVKTMGKLHNVRLDDHVRD